MKIARFAAVAAALRLQRWAVKQLAAIRQPHASLSPRLTMILAGSAILSAMSRGADYIAIDENRPESLSFVERAMPLDWWGLLLLGAGLFAGASWLFRIWGGVIVGHVTLSVTFVMFGVGSLVSVTGDAWSGSGWRSGVGFIAGAGVLHGMLALAATSEWDHVRARRQHRNRETS